MRLYTTSDVTYLYPSDAVQIITQPVAVRYRSGRGLGLGESRPCGDVAGSAGGFYGNMHRIWLG
jgi:hypothetical protein